MVEYLRPDEVLLFAPGLTLDKAAAMIRSVRARAVSIAPCLNGDLTPDQVETVRAILLDAVVRWADAGSGAVTHQAAGPFTQTVDARVDRRGAFIKSELDDLRGICDEVRGMSSGAFSIYVGGGRVSRPSLDDAALRDRGWLV